MMHVGFNKPLLTGNEKKHVLQAMQSDKISGDGYFGKKCQTWFEEQLGCSKALLTPSCTAALEMAAILIDIQPGDEVIMPSYTFVSTANAFVLRGAKIVFVDIHADTMNIDETKIEAAITDKTKAIVPVHYAGSACEMDSIIDIARRFDLFVIEDAAQGMMSTYKGRPLGTIGHLGTYSFHETKNFTSGGEGGLLLINDHQFIKRAEIVREKGTNRSLFFRGEVDKYSWVDIGSNMLLSELQAAYLWGQLSCCKDVINYRLSAWEWYYQRLAALESTGKIQRQSNNYIHNGHMFFIKVESLSVRDKLLAFLRDVHVMAVFHYVPLHLSEIGKRLGYFHGQDVYTTIESERIIRLPLWFGISNEQQEHVCCMIEAFFNLNSTI